MRRFLLSAGLGAVIAVLAMVIQLCKPSSIWGEGVAEMFAAANWPVDKIIHACAALFQKGSIEVAIPFAVVLWAVYWIALGVLLGTGIHLLGVVLYVAIKHVVCPCSVNPE